MQKDDKTVSKGVDNFDIIVYTGLTLVMLVITVGVYMGVDSGDKVQSECEVSERERDAEQWDKMVKADIEKEFDNDNTC